MTATKPGHLSVSQDLHGGKKGDSSCPDFHLCPTHKRLMNQNYYVFRKKGDRDWKVAQWLRVLAAVPMAASSVPSTHMW